MHKLNAALQRRVGEQNGKGQRRQRVAEGCGRRQAYHDRRGAYRRRLTVECFPRAQRDVRSPHLGRDPGARARRGAQDRIQVAQHTPGPRPRSRDRKRHDSLHRRRDIDKSASGGQSRRHSRLCLRAGPARLCPRHSLKSGPGERRPTVRPSRSGNRRRYLCDDLHTEGERAARIGKRPDDPVELLCRAAPAHGDRTGGRLRGASRRPRI